MEPPKPVYKCRIFQVFEEEVTLPHGRVSRQSRIEHQPCIAVVPVDENGQIILIRQYRHAVGQFLLEIPAGGLDVGEESIEDCVQRELAEEIGYQAKRLVKLFSGYLVPGYCDEYMHYYLALGLFPAPLPPDDDEDIESIRVSREDAGKMIKNGDICDSKTALGLLMALEYLGSAAGQDP
jgi:ADP-ribose pyrophosphatase